MPNYPSTVCEIVGVIPDTKYNDLGGVTPPMAFGPDSQFPSQHPWTAMLIHSDLSSTRVIDSVKERVAQGILKSSRATRSSKQRFKTGSCASG
jgi:hypothetical protein